MGRGFRWFAEDRAQLDSRVIVQDSPRGYPPKLTGRIKIPLRPHNPSDDAR